MDSPRGRLSEWGLSCKDCLAAATIGIVQNAQPSSSIAENPFHVGSMVIATLGNPREKFWGAILALTPEGLSLCGIELASFDDLVLMVKEGDPFSPAVRSEEHTSELQSRGHLVCRLLLEKKNMIPC